MSRVFSRHYVTFTRSWTGSSTCAPLEFSNCDEAESHAKDYNRTNQDSTWNHTVAHAVTVQLGSDGYSL